MLDRWCAEVGRDPSEVERTVGIDAHEFDAVDSYLSAGATHLVVMTGHPYDLAPVQRLLELARA